MKLIDADALKKYFFRPYSNEECYTNVDIAEIIDALPVYEQQRWIPCSERLPDDTTYENHLVVVYCTKSGTVDVGWYEAFFKKWWRLEPDEETCEEVVAWMPLPEPYKGGDSE